jgi:DNA primase
VAIEHVVGQYLELRPSGQNYTGRCPFHDDHVPSLVVYPATQTFYCFACRARGDVLSFLMQIEEVGFPEALKVLREIVSHDHDGSNQGIGK